ncbi:MAG: bile acid:sodium symporter family protein [Treponema sp.]|nr:bile acid:sodium symporter family protein [Treponema sp.]
MPHTRTAVEIAVLVNQKLERMIPLLTPVGAGLGIFFPKFFILLRPLAPWLFSLMTLSGALKLRTREMGAVLKNPLPLLLFFISAHTIMPVLVLLISRIAFRNDTEIISGYILLYATPTAVTGFVWSSIFHGDPALSLALILLDTLVSPFAAPATVSLLLGASVIFNAGGMILSLILMVVIPTVVGVGANEISGGRIPDAVCPYLTPFSKICILCVIAANSAAVAPQIHFESLRIWIIVICCICFTCLGFLLAKLAGLVSRLNYEKQASVFFASGLRNTTAAMTIAIEYFPPGAALPAVMGIIFQQSMCAIMGRLLMRKK